MKPHSLRALLLPCLVLLTAVICSGCLDVDQELTINPDGSGKVVLDATIAMPMFAMSGGSRQEVQKELNEFAASIIENSSGIDVWKDVSCTKSAKGGLHFKGTAYFADLTQLRINMAPVSDAGSSSMFATIDRAGDSMTITFGIPPTDMGSMLGNGNSSQAPSNPGPGPDSSMAAEKPTPFSSNDDQTEADSSTGNEMDLSSIHLDTLVKQMAGSMGKIALGVLSQMRMHIAVNLPGTVRSSEVLVAETGNRVALTFPDTATMAGIKALLADDDYWNRVGTDSAKPEPHGLFQGLSIKKSPRVVITDAKKPLFNYDAETAAAKKKYPALKKKLGVHENGQFSLLRASSARRGRTKTNRPVMPTMALMQRVDP